MKASNTDIKNAILEAALPNIPFDGWTMETLQQAAVSAGYAKAMVMSVFPAGVRDAISYFSSWADERMMQSIELEGSAPTRIRDKITLAVRTRFEQLEPYKEAERLAIAYWMRPLRKFSGVKLVWKTADAIWLWAGDTSTDYNRYTKRTLLSGVITATALFWLGDKSAGSQDSWAFLDRRIDNVLSVGKIVGRLKTA
jgi:ubiquinone biosynthesis protein COQ9